MSVAVVEGRAPGGEVLPAEAYAVALLALPGMWPARLAALLGQRREPRPGGSGLLFDDDGPIGGTGAVGPRRAASSAWALVRRGLAADVPGISRLARDIDPEVLAAMWASAACRVDVGRLWAAHRRRGVVVDLLGAASYPSVLSADFEAPYALFRQGVAPALDGPRVAIVGTRRCTPMGREIAVEWGEALATAGVRVISGLALGIDAAAHQGALGARRAAPIGVVAGGFDLPYPARHRVMWTQVCEAGVLVSEWPLGTRSEGWRFPARNRIIAGLADAVIVVESKEAGGSMITAEAAINRGLPVLAVPGSIRNPAAAGTNKLIRDGAEPVCSIDDVLARLSLQPAVTVDMSPRPQPKGVAARVLEAVGWEPTPTSALLSRTGLEPASLTAELARLEVDGWVAGGGGWWQRSGAG